MCRTERIVPTHIIQDATTLIDEGLDDGPPFINLVMNVHRNFQNAMPFSPRHLQMMVDLLPKNSVFCVSGIGPSQLEANISARCWAATPASAWKTTCTTATANWPPMCS